MPRTLTVLSLAALISLGCEQTHEESGPATPKQSHSKAAAKSPAPTTTPPQAKTGYSIPDRTPEELDRGLRAACQQGSQSKQPLLIEFSAPWCGDCRRLAELKQEPALAKKLSEVPHYVVNVGHFDRHDGLLKDFKIRAIANWKIVETSDCSQPIADWPRLAGRTLEPQSGKKITSSELVTWLDEKMK